MGIGYILTLRVIEYISYIHDLQKKRKKYIIKIDLNLKIIILLYMS